MYKPHLYEDLAVPSKSARARTRTATVFFPVAPSSLALANRRSFPKGPPVRGDAAPRTHRLFFSSLSSLYAVPARRRGPRAPSSSLSREKNRAIHARPPDHYQLPPFSMSMAKNSAGAFVLSSAPASAPTACPLSKDHSPVRLVSRISLPSRDAIRPRNSSLSPTLCACAAMGVRQEPSSAARNARSHSTPMRVSSWFSS